MCVSGGSKFNDKLCTHLSFSRIGWHRWCSVCIRIGLHYNRILASVVLCGCTVQHPWPFSSLMHIRILQLKLLSSLPYHFRSCHIQWNGAHKYCQLTSIHISQAKLWLRKAAKLTIEDEMEKKLRMHTQKKNMKCGGDVDREKYIWLQ